MTLEQIWCKPALVLEAAPPPPAREAAIRRETPQFLVEQATQGAQEQRPGAGPVPGGVLLYLVPRSGDLGGAEQRVPVVGEVARIARQDFVRSLTVQYDLDAIARCQLHEVEPRNWRPRDDGLILKAQHLDQAVPHRSRGQGYAPQLRACLGERVGNKGALIERGLVIAKGQERGRPINAGGTALAVARHGANDRRRVEPAGETHAYRNVASQTDAHGILEQLCERVFDP